MVICGLVRIIVEQRVGLHCQLLVNMCNLNDDLIKAFTSTLKGGALCFSRGRKDLKLWDFLHFFCNNSRFFRRQERK